MFFIGNQEIFLYWGINETGFPLYYDTLIIAQSHIFPAAKAILFFQHFHISGIYMGCEINSEQASLLECEYVDNTWNPVSFQQQEKRRLKWIVGVVFIVIVAVIWVFASVLVQFVFHNLGFDKPFFLTFIANSLFAINLPIYWIGLKCGLVRKEIDLPANHATMRETMKISAIVAPLWFLANFTYNVSLNMTRYAIYWLFFTDSYY